jgi:6,7-dimethyl-8-ribityllumazine synthase
MTAIYPLSTDGASPTGRIAFIQSCWHKQLVDQTLAGFNAELARLGFSEGLVDRWELPGAFEIPLHAKRLAKTGRYAAIVAAALVVDGGVYRHEFVAETVLRALMQVQLETGTPVFSVVLTPHHFHEHAAHAAFFRDHLVQKGEEAARACAATMASLARIPASV